MTRATAATAETQRAAALFLRRAAALVGDDRVFATAEDRGSYSDKLAFRPADRAPSGAVAVERVAEVQALLRLSTGAGC